MDGGRNGNWTAPPASISILDCLINIPILNGLFYPAFRPFMIKYVHLYADGSAVYAKMRGATA
ncbi:MAG: hypothetical protein LBC53_07175 [Spirochaetaceae bacterium]|nr:hypothetical protein [Spirochaetaceae bacterium]